MPVGYIQIKPANDEEMNDFRRRAKAAGMTVSTYGHMLLFGHDKRMAQLEAQVERMAEDLAAFMAARGCSDPPYRIRSEAE